MKTTLFFPGIHTTAAPAVWRIPLFRLLCVVGLLSLPVVNRAAIPVGPTGVGPLTFDTVPLAEDFITSTNNGDATIYADNVTMDAGVNSRSAESINSPLSSSGTVNPSTSILGFRYNTALRAIQSRPTTGTAPNNCAANLLVATFQMDTLTKADSNEGVLNPPLKSFQNPSAGWARRVCLPQRGQFHQILSHFQSDPAPSSMAS